MEQMLAGGSLRRSGSKLSGMRPVRTPPRHIPPPLWLKISGLFSSGCGVVVAVTAASKGVICILQKTKGLWNSRCSREARHCMEQMLAGGSHRRTAFTLCWTLN